MDFAFDTDKWPFVPARWFTDVAERRKVRLVVIHSMEAPEKGSTAENIARYFTDPRDKNGKPVKASAHLCIDNDSIVQCVLDNDVAYAAPGANNDGIQLELAGFARQKRADWLDPYSTLVLENAANAAAQYCLKYNIPLQRLTNDQLKRGERGIIGHVQASQVYKKSTHTDPGTGFPWDYFIERVKKHYLDRVARSQAFRPTLTPAMVSPPPLIT